MPLVFLFIQSIPRQFSVTCELALFITAPSGAACQVVTYPAGSQPLQIITSDLGVEPAVEGELEAQAQAVFDHVPVAAHSVMTVLSAVTSLQQARSGRPAGATSGLGRLHA